MLHVLESQVPVADGPRAERLPQRRLLRLLCSRLSFPGRAPSFKLSLPLFCGLLRWEWGRRGGGRPPRSEMGCSHLSLSGLHGGPARGESAVVRITVGGPPSTAPACCWGELRQADPAPCWPPPRPHATPPAGRGLPTLFRSGPLGRCCWCPPQGPSAPSAPGSPTAALRRPGAFSRAVQACSAPARGN